MTILYNKTILKNRRRELRKNQTDCEKKLWYYLRNKGLHGIRFLRQYSIGPFIVDFYSQKYKAGIEVDGGQHMELINQKYDAKRSVYFNKYGIKLLRFGNNEIRDNIHSVIQKIEEFFKNPSSPPL